jgi:hypothetical protein
MYGVKNCRLGSRCEFGQWTSCSLALEMLRCRATGHSLDEYMNLNHLKIRTRFMLLLGLFVCGFALYGSWSFKTLNELKVNGPLYQRIVQNKDLIADILPPPEYIIESYLVKRSFSR